MARTRSLVLIFCSAMLVAGCSFTADTLWPALTGQDPAGGDTAAPKPAPKPQPRQQVQIAPSQGEIGSQPLVSPSQPPILGRTNFVAPGVTSGQSTGTFVGQKVVMLRGELRRMQQGIGLHNGRLQQIRTQTGQHSQRYHGTIAAINARAMRRRIALASNPRFGL